MKPDRLTLQKRYDRLAPFFDVLTAMMEGLSFKTWRQRLWQQVDKDAYHILEVGVGTGKNFAYYPGYAQITAIDFSTEMLKHAQQKRDKLSTKVELYPMDVESLCFADNSFDVVVASFVFCSVPHPLKGLKELYRVCKPGGQVILLEHVISSNPTLAWLMQRLNPLVRFLFGANINRDTVKHIQSCPFTTVHVDVRSRGLVKLIEARK